MNTNNLDDSQKQFIGPTGMPEEPEVEHLLKPGQGTQTACTCGKSFPTSDLANQHQAWHKDRHYRQKYLKVLDDCGNEPMPRIGKSGRYIRSPQSFQDGFEEARAALKEAFK